MKRSTVIAIAAAASVANAQGYNQTHSAPYDARTVSVGSISRPVPTALTSLYTVTSSCGSLTIYYPATSVYPLPADNAARTSAIFTGSSTGAAALPTAAAGMGIVGIAAAAAVML